MTDDQLLKSAIATKLYEAEYHISVVRFMLILANTVMFLFFMDHETTVLWLAWTIMIVGNIYSVFVLVFKPYEKIAVLRASYFTTITDGGLITLWLFATGGAASVFNILWYISIIAVAMRFTEKETLVTALVYLCLDMTIVLLDNVHHLSSVDMLVRFSYIPIAGVLGSFFSREVRSQIHDKVSLSEAEKQLKRNAAGLEMRVKMRTEELEVKNKDIMDSINYAKRIQNAILPSAAQLNSAFSSMFIMYKPKDIISGDFYWLHERIDKTFLAMVDCTGHGVPGALMSMIGNDLLDSLIKDRKLTDPKEILEEMDRSITRLLHQDDEDLSVSDGMVISLCVIDKINSTLSFGGAQQTVMIKQNGDLTELTAARQSIGGMLPPEFKKFKTETLNINQGDRLYLFTDGFKDQFGGPNGRKFLKKNVRSLIEAVGDKPMEEQGKLISEAFESWKGHLSQVDDVSIWGVEI